MPQIPGPIVEAVKHIAQELLQQRVVLRVGDIWRGAPDRISECIVDSVPVGKHQQPLTVRQSKGHWKGTVFWSNGSRACSDAAFQLQFIDRFVDGQVVLEKSPLVNLNGLGSEVVFWFGLGHVYDQ